MEAPLKVLILCTGNSCRSILVEAYLRHIADGRIEVHSAGSHPTGQVNPNSIDTLERHGISTEGLRSKSWDELSHISFDLVITVCDNAAGESCPLYLRKATKIHWGVPDPAGKEADEFDRVFDMLREPLEALAALPLEALQEREFAEQVKSISLPGGHDAEISTRRV